MRRLVTIVAAIGLVAGACGGDDDTAESDTAAPSEQVADEPAADSDDAASGSSDSAEPAEPAEDVADQSPDDVEEDPDGDTSDQVADEPSDGTPILIRSVDDVPEDCRDRMAEFMRDLEPIVSQIDWENATLAEFENIAPQFEEISDRFDQAFNDSKCDALEFADDVDEFDLLTEFAGGEAPGVVEFFNFMQSLSPVLSGDDDGNGAGDSAPSAFSDCTGAIEWIESLIAQYDQILDVPAAQLTEFASLAMVLPTCTPEQQAFFNSEAVIEFLAEF